MNDAPVSQLSSDGKLRHLLTLEDLPVAQITRLLDAAQSLCAQAHGALVASTRFPAGVGSSSQGPELRAVLAGRTVCTLFFEPSTRTRASFQLAATRLGADVLAFDVLASSAKKGETALDTVRNLEAMGVGCFVVRHGDDGAVAALAAGADPSTRFVNAGDGRSAHPTQGLLDMLTLRQRKGADFSALKVLILGDVKHSRVARSDLHALRALGAGEIRVCAPASLLPDERTLRGCRVVPEADAALDGVDAVIVLRLQHERMEEGLVPSLDGYFRDFGLTPDRLRLAKPDAVVMHPGPMNRGVEIADAVADGPQSAILEQVSNGVAVRMAVLMALHTD
jgi:aspartate carbamoyltransferase catalytic subunit